MSHREHSDHRGYSFSRSAHSAVASPLAPGSTLTRDVAHGTPITYAAVALDETMMIVQLRRMQDQMVQQG